MKIALLGGSFDPPHLAHLQVVRYLLSRGEFDQVWVYPTRQNPFKTTETSFEHRLEMCRLAFSEFGDRVQVLDAERRLSGFTIDLVRHLLKSFPEHRFTFVGGSDLQQELPRWKDAETLKGLIDFEFLPRPPDPDSPFLDLSSSEVRQALIAGDPAERFLPKKVAEFVKNKPLYRSS